MGNECKEQQGAKGTMILHQHTLTTMVCLELIDIFNPMFILICSF